MCRSCALVQIEIDEDVAVEFLGADRLQARAVELREFPRRGLMLEAAVEAIDPAMEATVEVGGMAAPRHQRPAAMIDWSPSEFSRVRLQYARAKTVDGLSDNEWFVQYILSMGAHGAHKF